MVDCIPSSGTMTASPGSTIPHISTTTLTLKADPTNLAAGSTHTGTITYVANQVSSDTTSVTLNVASKTTASKFAVAPQSLSFNYMQGSSNVPAVQSISVFSQPAGAGFTASASSSGNWLTAGASSSAATPGSVSVSVNVANLSPGVSTGNVTITAGTTIIDVPVTVTVVAAATPPSLSVSPAMENFSLTQGSSAASGQVTISNTGGGTLTFTAQSNQGWLTLISTGGAAAPSLPASLSFTVDPSGLSAGLYTGQITVSDTNSSSQATVTVILTVTQAAPSIQLSATGLSITAVAGGAQPPPQSFTVANSGAGSLSWTAQATTLSGGNWLQAAPGSGTSSSGQPGTAVSVSVNTAGLTAGQYYGSVNIMSPGTPPGAANSPQAVSVVMNVVPSQASPGGDGFNRRGHSFGRRGQQDSRTADGRRVQSVIRGNHLHVEHFYG